MKPSFSGPRSEPQRSDYDAWWFSPADGPVSDVLSDICDIGIGAPDALSQPFVCFVPVSGDSLASQVRAARSRLGDNAYIVMVFDGAALLPAAVRAVEFGADDVGAAGDRQGLALALARAERVTQERRRAVAIHRARDLEHDYLQACIDNLPTPIFYKNERGVYIGCNKAFYEFLGVSVDAVIGHTAYDIACNESAQIYEEADRALMEKGGTQFYEAIARHSDGNPRNVVFQKAVMTDSMGVPRGIAGAMLDITDRKQLEAKLADAAARDPLTNIYNRRKFFHLANDCLAESLMHRRPVSLAVIDIDHFKQVNDRYGHAAGDRVLCEVAAQLVRSIGAGNIVARAGGEEFFAILPDQDLSAASAQMERLRAAVADLKVEDSSLTLSVTVSIGVAQLADDGEDVWSCLRRADHALYEAKHGGRNCISLAA